MKKTYFLAPTRDSHPSGPIALGNLIKDPRAPEIALNDLKSDTVRRLVEESIVTSEIDATRELTSGINVKPSVWASFLSGLGPGGDLGLDVKHEKGVAFNIAKLTTRTINPSMAAIKAIFQEPEVQDAIKDSRFRANLYIITGIQIAHGAEYLVSKTRERGGHLHGTVDLTPVSAPVSIGAGVEISRSKGQTSGGLIQSDFVFAYSLREILYKRKKAEEQKTVAKGDLWGHDQPETKAPERQDDDEGVTAELSGLKEDDPDLPEYWDLETGDGLDYDGNVCQYVRVEGGDEEED